MSDNPIERHNTVVPSGPPRASAKLRADRRAEVREFLGFELADERFALPLSAVREILKVAPITDVPRARPHVLGILSVRGRITTVFDLRRRLRMPTIAPTKASRILLVDSGDEIIGLLVDAVHQVYRLHSVEIELSATVAGDLSEYVMGIGRPGALHEDGELRHVADDILILLDPEPLLKRG